MKPAVLGFLGVCVASAVADAADLRCTEADKSNWLQPAQVTQMLLEHGFVDVGAVDVSDGNCYVVQAVDSSGARKTLYLDPTDGALMALE